jgi:hypothetical protein
MESIANQSAAMTSLYRPIPVSTLQGNLAQYYQRTSKFVDEQFDELVNVPGQEGLKSKSALKDEAKEKPRLNPSGVGGALDIYA